MLPPAPRVAQLLPSKFLELLTRVRILRIHFERFLVGGDSLQMRFFIEASQKVEMSSGDATSITKRWPEQMLIQQSDGSATPMRGKSTTL
jgi:hypothetical protein